MLMIQEKEEARRLFYVACTRAAKQLFVSWSFVRRNVILDPEDSSGEGEFDHTRYGASPFLKVCVPFVLKADEFVMHFWLHGSWLRTERLYIIGRFWNMWEFAFAAICLPPLISMVALVKRVTSFTWHLIGRRESA